MASERKELVNCLKIQILVKNITKEALVEMLKHYLGQNSMSFKDFIDAHMADIKCLRRTTILYKKDVSKLIVGDKAISDIREDNLEGMLVRRLLVNLCPDLFMDDGCKTLQDFLKTNQHDIYHLFKFNEPCCQCLHDYKFPVTSQLLDEDQYKKMFKLSPCTNCTGTSGTVCSVSSCIATDYIRLDYNIKTKVFGHFSPIFKVMLKLADIRNDADGHLEKAAIPNERYDAYKRDIEESIMVLAKICGNEDKMQRALDDVEKLCIEELKEKLKTTEANLTKGEEATQQVDMKTMKVLTEVSKSIGMFVGKFPGSCWRAGTDLIVTAWHVVRNNIREYEDLKVIKLKEVKIKFDYTDSGDCDESNIFEVEPNILYHNETLDTAILRLKPKDKVKFPPPFRRLDHFLIPAEDEDLTIYLIGHPDGSPQRVNLVGLWNPTEERMQSLATFCKDEGYEYGYAELDKTERLVLKCEFEHGAAGCPGVVFLGDNQVYLVTMYLKGFPDFYWSLLFNRERKKKFPKSKLFQQGVNIRAIYEDLNKNPIYADIFEDIFKQNPPVNMGPFGIVPSENYTDGYQDCHERVSTSTRPTSDEGTHHITSPCEEDTNENVSTCTHSITVKRQGSQMVVSDIYDGVVLHAEDDRDAAIEFIRNMERENPDLNMKITLYENLDPGTSELESPAKCFDSCRYVFVFVTHNFVKADLERLLSEIATIETLTFQEKNARLIPVKTDKTHLFALAPLKSLQYDNYLEAKKSQQGPDRHFIECFAKLINNGRKEYLVN